MANSSGDSPSPWIVPRSTGTSGVAPPGVLKQVVAPAYSAIAASTGIGFAGTSIV